MEDVPSQRPWIWTVFFVVLFSSSLHVLYLTSFPSDAIGLLSLVFLGLGWRCRTDQQRLIFLVLTGICASVWIQTGDQLFDPQQKPSKNQSISGVVLTVESSQRKPEWKDDPRRPPPVRWMQIRTPEHQQRVLLPRTGQPSFNPGDHIQCTTRWLCPRPPVMSGLQNKDSHGVALVQKWSDVKIIPPEKSMHSGFLIKIRDSHRERISKVIELMSGGSDTTRHWFNALILGDARGQSIQSWRSIGLGHLGAISGMHVGMLLFSALIPLRLLGLRMPWQAFVGMVVISVLLFTVPWRAPVLRASMNGLLVLPIFFGASRWLFLSTLVGIASTLLLFDPSFLTAVGFQCSFVATAAIGLSMQRMRWRPFDDWPRRLFRLLVVMTAPWLAVLPIGAYHFGVVHPYGAVLTMLVAPLLSVVLPTLWVAVLFCLWCPELGPVLGFLLQPLLASIQWAIDALRVLPGVELQTNLFRPESAASACLVTLGILCLFGTRFRLALVAFVVAYLCFPKVTPHHAEPNRLVWDVISLGNGSSHLLHYGPKAWIIDAGSTGDLNVARQSILPALRRNNISSLEGIVCTHGDLDHIGGVVPIMNHISVGILRIPPLMWREATEDPTSPCHALLARAREKDVKIEVTVQGDQWSIGPAKFVTLWPPESLVSENRNHGSLAIELLIHGRRLRFSGDADSQSTIADIQTEALADVFELPHHGARCPGLGNILLENPPRLLLQSSNRRRSLAGPWCDWSGSPHLATGLVGGIRIEVDSDGTLSATARNRFYTWYLNPSDNDSPFATASNHH